jgi:hypothetical protein
VRAVLLSHANAIAELQIPTQPRPLWSHPTGATLEATAPADSYRDCYCLVEDINSIAVSTLVAGVYAWRRADGSGL